MNRMEEFEALQRELREVPPSDCVQKAIRRRRKRSLGRTFGTVAAVFCLFVGSINLSPTVSAACREIPFIGELTELLTFNPSLQLAADHDFVQLIEQEQTKGGITARIEDLIVDQKQLNIYYRLSSQQYKNLSSTPQVENTDGTDLKCSVSYGGLYEENDTLRDMTVDSHDADLPAELLLTLRVYDNGSMDTEGPAVDLAVPSEEPKYEEPEILEEFEFLLQFDPQFTAQGREVTLNREVQIAGQTFTVTDMEIYPTHIRINVDEAADNTAWLQSLHFHLETEDGRRVETISNGISASGSETTPSMTSYRAESTFFYDADAIRLVIEGADLLDKAREEVHINLKTLEADPLPAFIRLEDAARIANGWELHVRIKDDEFRHVQAFRSRYRDAEGVEYDISRHDTFVSSDDPEGRWKGWGKETYYLDGFPADEVWLGLYYTDFWKPSQPLVVELQ